MVIKRSNHKSTGKKRAIRVLHVFSPDFKYRFGGPFFIWKHNFLHWDDPAVNHHVLDYEKDQMVDLNEAFNFKYPEIQKMTSRWQRVIWIFSLFIFLMKFKEQYDILHFHVLWWGSLLAAPWAKWSKKTLIYESVLLDADTPGGILKTKLGKLKVRFLKSYSAIIAISESLAQDYLKFGFSPGKVFTLVNSVDSQLFSPVKTAEEKISLRLKNKIPAKVFVLTFVGSVIERKGVDKLIQAFVEASSKCPYLYLVIVGPKDKHANPSLDENFVNGLYSMLDQHNLRDRVSFMGLVQDRQKLAEIYRTSDIFVFPSNLEGLPNVILEAMASGLPVVVSQLPVLEKIITHGENGLFVPVGDTDALRDSIISLYSDPSLAKEIGYNALHYVKKYLGFRTWQARLVEIYQSLV